MTQADMFAEVSQTLARDLASGRVDSVAALFAAQRASAPSIVWSPSSLDVRHPMLRGFAHECGRAMSADGRLSRAAFERLTLTPFDNWLMVLDLAPDASDFTYERYGSEIAAIHGKDMTGRRVSEFGGHIALFFLAAYRAVAVRGEWLLTAHEPPLSVFTREWRRLIAPLFDDDGRVRRFAVLNVPDNELREGLEALPDPVLVVDEARRVHFANSAARAVFGERSFILERVGVGEYCGFEPLLAEGAVQERVMALRGSLLVHFDVVTRPILHRDNPFHVIVARPD